MNFRTSELLKHKNISHGFFGRRGGQSRGIYKGLNVGLFSDDDFQSVTINRNLIAEALSGKTERLITLKQIHSSKVHIIKDTNDINTETEGDGLVTDQAGIVLCAQAADCAPVLFADPKAKIIGAAHAGWKGAFGGVIEATVSAMVALGATPRYICAAIGPCISQISYEVGPEFYEAITENDLLAVTCFSKGRADRWHFDLKAYCAMRLGRAGIGQIDVIADDTLTRPDDYYSYRYNQKQGISDYGRNASAITLKA